MKLLVGIIIATLGMYRGVKDKDEEKDRFLAGRLAHTGEKLHCLWPGREVKVS